MATTARLTAADEAQTVRLGEALGALLEPSDIVILAGDLGAGKTTFVKGAAAGLGVSDHVTSPTFTIVHELLGRIPLVHVDLYRIDRESQLEDLGLDDLIAGRAAAMIEWGDRFPALAGQGALTVEFHYVDAAGGDAGGDAGEGGRADEGSRADVDDGLESGPDQADGGRLLEVKAVGPRAERLLDDWIARCTG